MERRTRPDATRLELLAEVAGLDPDELRASLRRQIHEALRRDLEAHEASVERERELPWPPAPRTRLSREERAWTKSFGPEMVRMIDDALATLRT